MTLPFENDTNAIVKKLADRSMKADKRRNLFIIVTIAFAVCLMTTLALYTFGKSYELKTFLRGRYQAAVREVEPQMIAALLEDEMIETVGTQVTVNSFRIEDYTFNVNYRDSNAVYLFSIDLKGRLPETEDEIAISSSYLKHLGLEASIGQKITLPLKDEEAQYSVCGIINDDDGRRYCQVLVSDAFLQSYYMGTIPYEVILRIAGSEHFKPEEVKEIVRSCLGAYGIEEIRIAFSSSYFNSIDNSSRQ